MRPGSGWFALLITPVVLSGDPPEPAFDPAFGTNGRTLVAFDAGGGNDDEPRAAARHLDGVIACGTVDVDMGQAMGLTRLTAAGVVDAAFGTAGVVIQRVPGTDESLSCDDIEVQSDGKIVAVGTILRSDNHQEFAIVRFNPDGTLDTSFDADGVSPIKPSPDMPSNVGLEIALDGEGGIYAAGQVQFTSTPEVVVVRLSGSGVLDTNFGDMGVVRVPFDGAIGNTPIDLDLSSDGDVVVTASLINEVSNSVGVARFDPSGLIASFGTPTVGLGDPMVTNAAVDQRGRVVASGSIGGRIYAMRVDADGRFDGSFGNGGVFTLDVPTSNFDSANAVIVLPDQTVLIGGSSPSSFNFTFPEGVLIALDRDGQLIDGFGTNGLQVFRFENTHDASIDAFVVDQGGAIVVGRDQFNSIDFGFAKAIAGAIFLSGFEGGAPVIPD